MERVFTKDVGRFKAGDIRSYSMPVWKGIEQSAKDRLETFSKELEGAAKEYAATSKPTTAARQVGRPKKK